MNSGVRFRRAFGHPIFKEKILVSVCQCVCLSVLISPSMFLLLVLTYLS